MPNAELTAVAAARHRLTAPLRAKQSGGAVKAAASPGWPGICDIVLSTNLFLDTSALSTSLIVLARALGIQLENARPPRTGRPLSGILQGKSAVTRLAIAVRRAQLRRFHLGQRGEEIAAEGRLVAGDLPLRLAPRLVCHE